MHLVVQYPNGRRMTYPLRPGDMIVGRDAACDVTLDDRITSRQHARLSLDAEGRFWIQDLESKNGISLNERPVQRSAVRPGDRIGIGTCELFIEDDRANEPRLVDTPGAQSAGTATTSAWGTDQQLDLPQRRLQTLYDLNERLTGRFEKNDLLGELLNVSVENLRFERAGIAVWDGEPRRLEWTHLRNLSGQNHDDFRISRSVVDRALHNAERILIIDTGDFEMNPTASMISNHITAAMCVPMEYLGEVRGVIYGDRVTSSGGYTREDIDFFAAMGRLGAMGLANVHLVDEIRRRQEIETQLTLARTIQQQLFPQTAVENDAISIFALNEPGARVSGDYYDYFVRPDGRVGIIVADVAGKGVSASLLMANLQAAVRLLLTHSGDLLTVVREINRLICSNIATSRFITGFFGLLDVEQRRLSFVNCGHLPPIVVRGDSRVEQFACEAHLPLGIEVDYAYRADTLDLPDSPSTVFLYTDGVNEAEDEGSAQFGSERLLAAIENNAAQSPEELVHRVRRLIKQFTRNHPQSDDITMLALQLS